MKRFSKKTFNPKGQSGFTLIEALVAIVIMALGLIGLALMQAQGMKFTTSAYARTQASMLANDIIDRMRVHSNQLLTEEALLVSQGSTDPAAELDDYIDNFITSAQTIEANSGLCNAAGTAIDPAELVLHEVACWKDAIDSQLNGTATMSWETSTVVNVTISWTDRDARDVGDGDSSSTRRLSILTEFTPIE